MNMTTCIILDIDFHSSCYEDTFTDIYIHIGVNIGESLSLPLHRINTIRQHYRLYQKDTHVKILKAQLFFKWD